MSSSRPVPEYRLPNWALVYQSVRHAVPRTPSMARCAFCGSSPVPWGPNAAALAGAMVCGRACWTGAGVGVGPVVGGAGLAVAGPDCPAAGALDPAVAREDRAASGRPAAPFAAGVGLAPPSAADRTGPGPGLPMIR